MRTSKPHGMRNAVLVALFLLGSGTLANMYLNESESRDRIVLSLGLALTGLAGGLLRLPSSRFCPDGFSIERQCQSRENATPVY